MKKYKIVLFDLDHTLWDYDRNSKETLQELYDFHQINNYKIAFDDFHNAFQKTNISLWDLYDTGKIDRHVIRNDRFPLVLKELLVVNNDLARALSDHYFELSPTKKHLVSNALEVLNYLQNKYPMLLVTNGFEKMQSGKAESSGIRKYFQEIITSERAGHKKPSKEIFEFALNQSGFANHEAIMIGDNLLTDMAGATNASIDSVLYNPKETQHTSMVTHEIKDLIELTGIL